MYREPHRQRVLLLDTGWRPAGVSDGRRLRKSSGDVHAVGLFGGVLHQAVHAVRASTPSDNLALRRLVTLGLTVRPLAIIACPRDGPAGGESIPTCLLGCGRPAVARNRRKAKIERIIRAVARSSVVAC